MPADSGPKPSIENAPPSALSWTASRTLRSYRVFLPSPNDAGLQWSSSGFNSFAWSYGFSARAGTNRVPSRKTNVTGAFGAQVPSHEKGASAPWSANLSLSKVDGVFQFMFSIACLATTKGVVGPKAEDRFAAASVDRHFRRRKPHSMHAAGPVKAIPCRDDAHA